jgi:tetratricopeptide (TPR) repeat protein
MQKPIPAALIGCCVLFPVLGGAVLAPTAASTITPAASAADPGRLGQANQANQAALDAAIKDLRENRPQQAAKILAPLSAAQPKDLQVANLYANALTQLGQIQDARRVLESALSGNDETSLAFANLREILAQQAAVSYAKALGRPAPKGPPNLRLTADDPVVVAVAPEAAKPVAAPAPVRGPAAGSAAIAQPPALAAASDPKISTEISAALITLTQDWAKSWADKDFDAYLGFYSENFAPTKHPNRKAWEDNRRPRVTRSGQIVVEVSELRLKELSDGQIEVRFRQRYDSPTLKVNSMRFLVWANEAGAWKIVREEGR